MLLASALTALPNRNLGLPLRPAGTHGLFPNLSYDELTNKGGPRVHGLADGYINQAAQIFRADIVPPEVNSPFSEH